MFWEKKAETAPVAAKRPTLNDLSYREIESIRAETMKYANKRVSDMFREDVGPYDAKRRCNKCKCSLEPRVHYREVYSSAVSCRDEAASSIVLSAHIAKNNWGLLDVAIGLVDSWGSVVGKAPDSEYLAVTCVRCGYMWFMRTADHKEV